MACSQDYVLRNTEVTKKLLKMWNNVNYSDTKFLVNQTQFYASSHLVTVSSDALEYLVKNHYENCKDREITIRSIKHAESFATILRYIYGIDINFTQMSKAVMCEVLDLSDTYKLPEFSKELKSFLAKLESFQIDSVVVLLNTAKKFHLDELYEKLTIFAFENTEQLLKEESFKNLQFDVLRDLLKSDWFFAPETNILTSVLIWHSDMNKNPSNVKEFLNKVDESEGVAEETDDNNDGYSDVSNCETDLAEMIDTESDDENDKNSCLEESAESVSKSDHAEIETNISDQTDKCAELVQTFSQNILKSLLSYIRITQISLLDHMKFSRSELFLTYKEFMADCNYFSQNAKCRKKYGVLIHPITDNDEVQLNSGSGLSQCSSVAVTVATQITQAPISTSSTVPEVHNSVVGPSNPCPRCSHQQPLRNMGETVILADNSGISNTLDVPEVAENVNVHCIIEDFTVPMLGSCPELWIKSKEELLIGNKKWKISLRKANNYRLEIILNCRSDEHCWVTTVKCKFILLPNHSKITLNSPKDKSFKLITLSSQQPCVYFDAFDLDDYYRYFMGNPCIIVKAHFHTNLN